MKRSWQSYLFNLIVWLLRKRFRRTEQLHKQRAQLFKLDQRFTGRAETLCELRSESLSNFSVDWLVPHTQEQAENSDAKLLLFFHGGAYCLSSPMMYRWFIARHCQQLSAQAIMPDYRLSPEHKHPCAIDDCLETYKHVLEQGYRPENIALIGDSAGGGLALSLLVLIREQGLPMPASATLISPAGDWTLSGASFYESDGRDPFFHLSSLLFYRSLHLGDFSTADPIASPIFSDFNSFPPLYISASTTEMLRDIATKAAEKAKVAGVEVTLELASGLCHDWPLMDFLPESHATNERINGFIQNNWQQ